MFERYTETARRTIFFARYEASHAGSPYVEPIHLLAGLLREDKALFWGLLGRQGALDGLRGEIDARMQTGKEKLATSVDLPMSRECKQALQHAMEEADRTHSRRIDTRHLLIGLLSMDSPAAQALSSIGVDADGVRRVAATLGDVEVYAVENGELSLETHRNCFGHKVLIREWMRLSEDGKKLIYRQRVTGPGGKTGEFDIEFELPE